MTMPSTARMETITICGTGGSRLRVIAVVANGWAIHPQLVGEYHEVDRVSAQWVTLTHVGSGRGFGRGTPQNAERVLQALVAMEAPPDHPKPKESDFPEEVMDFLARLKGGLWDWNFQLKDTRNGDVT